MEIFSGISVLSERSPKNKKRDNFSFETNQNLINRIPKFIQFKPLDKSTVKSQNNFEELDKIISQSSKYNILSS